MSVQEFYSALPTKPRKAITALLVTFVGAIGTALLSAGISREELGVAAGTALLAAAAVWRIPNPVNTRKLRRGPNPQQLPPEAFSGGGEHRG
jgi:hypothetical protein